jgi:hypothetical protein
MAAMMVSHHVGGVTPKVVGGGLEALPRFFQRIASTGVANYSSSVSSRPRLMMTSLAGRVRVMVRCEAGKGPFADAKEVVDRNTKKSITKEDILRNQETNESEKKSVMGTEPTSGSFYPRPEVERRPETGSKSFWSVFAFDGAAPETINCRLV